MRSEAIIEGNGRPLRLWQHLLKPGAAIALDASPVGNVFHVMAGAIVCDGAVVRQGGAVLAEHACRASVAAGADGATLLHFHAASPATVGAGGHLHIAGKNGRLRTGGIPGTHLGEGKGYRGTLWTELDCSTCQLWLYRSEIGGAVSQKDTLHYHSTDEIIYVLDGEMLLGARGLTAGTAVAVDAGARYRMGVGEHGVAFLNFRARDSMVVMLEQGNPTPIDEADTWRSGVVVT
jgi:hypothetical protein